jgi:hypothetical protein
MRKLLFLICVLGMTCASWAQSNPASWENLNTLQAGEKIQVLEMSSKKVSGTFVNVSDAGVSLQEKAGQQTVQRQDVRSVKLMKHQHRLRNTLIGAAVGAGAGAGIGAATHHHVICTTPCSLQNPNTFLSSSQAAAVGAVIGLVGGTVVGAVWPSHKTIYRLKSQ